MSVEPGFGGQKFMPATMAKVAQLKALRARLKARYLIEVDGGVDTTNAAALVESGATILVAGVSVFGTPDPAEATRRLRAAAGAR